MQKIKILSTNDIQKIAAGEVIERPANVVKELIENAIDAGATQIQIYIEQAGQQLIRVIDNGCGMSEKDAILCFEHHATSKISSFDDLRNCSTFGFRGEALSSIAAVSKISLLTKQQEANNSICIIRDSENSTLLNAASPTGTDISVRELYYNIPARKKFLKAMSTEWRHIGLLFQAFCFSYPHIHFSLFHDNKLVNNCPPVATIPGRLNQLWEHSTTYNMREINDTHDEITYSGAISNHQVQRYDRSSIIFLVNHRWIRNHSLTKAFVKGYMNVLRPDRFPAGVFSIKINPAEIDINVHPRKEEIQFHQGHKIEKHITQLVKKVLEINTNSPAKTLIKTISFEKNYNDLISQQITTRNDELYNTKLTTIESQQFSSKYPLENNDINEYRYIGTFALTYLLIESCEQFIIIDQHAAHERILYEKFKTQFGNIPVIELIFAQKVNLQRQELALLESYIEDIAKHGLIIELFNSAVLIRAVPVHLKECPYDKLIGDIIQIILSNNRLEKEQFLRILHEQLHAQMACKAAIKAGDILSPEQSKQLIKDLYATQNRFVCPHGRPTSWTIAQYEFEKKFKRKL